MDEYPNTDPKPYGAYVRNVHPCGHRDEGVVIQTEDGYDSITVRTGRGSTTFGPAVNWRPIATKPEWLERLELEEDAALERAIGMTPATLDLETLELAKPAARRRAVDLGGRHEARYYLISVYLEQLREAEQRRARRAA